MLNEGNQIHNFISSSSSGSGSCSGSTSQKGTVPVQQHWPQVPCGQMILPWKILHKDILNVD